MTLPVRVDKSHLVTIGERLYTESIELVRELVNNAYDADATEVHVTVTTEELRVADNGLGMDLEGLREYFTIGTPDKRLHPRSPRFGRPRIGQFGIGKFGTLAACERFVVYTQQGTFAAEVVFDKQDWERAEDRWDLPIRLPPPDPARGDGTTVILSRLLRRFEPAEVERRLMEGTPLRAPGFAVFLSGRRVLPVHLAGHRISVLEGTAYGPVHGEIVIAPAHQASTVDLGIEVKVRQVTVRRELFGAEIWGKDAARVRGEVHADFLPVTADRSGFVVDRDEYRAFLKVMEGVMGTVRQTIARLSDRKERQKTRVAVREAFRRIQNALARNPDLSPFGPVPYAAPSRGIGGAGVISPPRELEKSAPDEDLAEAVEASGQAPREVASAGPPAPPRKRQRKPKVRHLTPEAVVQRVRMGESGVTCCLDHFGPEGAESFSDGTAIYINRDHPLYVRNSRRRDTHLLHVARLLAQEISLMKDPRTPRQAFERQSKLLREAFVEE
ncbi:MAG: ATP-binding protein [Armatimonadota bacterium]